MRLTLIPLLLLAVASAPACNSTKGSIPSTPPTGMTTRPAEYAVLDRFLGRWEGTATMTKATGSYAEYMPKTSGGQLPSSKGGSKVEWTLGGHFVMTDGWYEMADGTKVHNVEYMTWDPMEKKYHTFYFGEDGESGEGWMTATGATTFTSTWKGMKNGKATKGTSKITFTTPDAMEWTFTEESDGGMMEMRGTSKR
jgi:hypothetical protein